VHSQPTDLFDAFLYKQEYAKTAPSHKGDAWGLFIYARNPIIGGSSARVINCQPLSTHFFLLLTNIIIRMAAICAFRLTKTDNVSKMLGDGASARKKEKEWK
jgi:hypothetical protein